MGIGTTGYFPQPKFSEVISLQCLTQDASGKNIADGKMITTGARIRNRFYDNLQTMALLMKNRAECLENPETKSLLSGVEPKFQEALNAELDKINAKYDEKVKDARSLVESSKESYQKYLDQGNDPKSPFMANARESWRQREDRLYFLENDKNGISNFLREELKNEAVQSGKIKTFFNASNIDDISNAELNELGHIDNVRNQLEERLGKYYDLSEKREQLTLGAHFFADMEVRLNKAADEGCKDLQTNVSKMIENVFPNPGNKVAHDPNSLAQASLGDIIGGPAEDNQLQLVKEAMKIYFQKMPVLDQRAMLAAEMRYCATNENTTDGARLGEILKGAGPIMQKMMQGLDPSMFARSPDFQIAVSDLKHRLAPISQDPAQA